MSSPCLYRVARREAPLRVHEYGLSGSHDAVLGSRDMPGAEWFPGARVNNAGHAFQGKHDHAVAIHHASESRELASWTRGRAPRNAVMEQVATIAPAFTAIRRKHADAFVRRNAEGIRRLQRAGLADSELDPMLTGDALSHMVSGMANRLFVHGREVAFDRLVWTGSRLWSNALGLTPEESDLGGEST